ncbi:hypothetical protein QBC45DRAFT_467042 [Copromyces sp. CBS 386.78]|nr:hypothetical protein QBC45DRAFT_467042 [Copromyces sp. CBS 386.78]
MEATDSNAVETGVPPTVRTPVLLKRRDGDTDGLFTMTVKITWHVHWWQDGEKVKRKDANIKEVDWRRLDQANLNRFLLDQRVSTRGLGVKTRTQRLPMLRSMKTLKNRRRDSGEGHCT